MSLQYSRSYDNVDGHTHYTIALNSIGTGVSFPGTQTANTVIKELFSCPTGVAGRLLGVKMKLTTGGTGDATAPPYHIGYSLDGTGTLTLIGTAAFGTRGNNSYLTITPDTSGTVNHFSADDVISIAASAGTVGATPVFVVQTIIWQELAV